MATNDVFSLHTEGGFDLLDLIGAPAFGLAAVVLSGIGTFSLMGFSLSEVVFSSSSISITWAMLVAALLLGASWVTNRAGESWDDLDEFESAAVAGGVLVVAGLAIVPAFQDWVLGSDIIGVAAFLALSAAYTVLAWY